MTGYSTEAAFDGPELVEWHTRHYGPTCSSCHVRFCGFTGRLVCPGCTPWEEAMPRDRTAVLEQPALSPRMGLTVQCFSRWAAAEASGHPFRAAAWRWAAEALDGLRR